MWRLLFHEKFFSDLISGCQCIRRMMSTYSKNDVNVSMSGVSLSLPLIINQLLHVCDTKTSHVSIDRSVFLLKSRYSNFFSGTKMISKKKKKNNAIFLLSSFIVSSPQFVAPDAQLCQCLNRWCMRFCILGKWSIIIECPHRVWVRYETSFHFIHSIRLALWLAQRFQRHMPIRISSPHVHYLTFTCRNTWTLCKPSSLRSISTEILLKIMNRLSSYSTHVPKYPDRLLRQAVEHIHTEASYSLWHQSPKFPPRRKPRSQARELSRNA
jgi:hypothetical protein